VIVEVLLGALAWTLLEYMMHRWLGHKFKRNPFGVEHVRHHVEGNYFAPSWKKVIFAAVIAALLALTAGIAFTAGLIGMYAAYGCCIASSTRTPASDRTAGGRAATTSTTTSSTGARTTA
jgi:hypothetical protein